MSNVTFHDHAVECMYHLIDLLYVELMINRPSCCDGWLFHSEF